MRKMIIASLALLLAWVPQASAQDVGGWGQLQCSQLNTYVGESSENRDAAILATTQWMWGYLTAVNVERYEAGEPRANLRAATNDSLLSAVMDFCSQVPSANVVNAGRPIYDELLRVTQESEN